MNDVNQSYEQMKTLADGTLAIYRSGPVYIPGRVGASPAEVTADFRSLQPGWYCQPANHYLGDVESHCEECRLAAIG